MQETLGQRLRRLRQMRELSLEEVAVRLNLSFSTVSMYERGERTPSLDKLELLADFYRVSLDELTGRSPNPSTPEAEEAPANPDIRYISRNGKRLTPEQAQRLRKMAEVMFPEVFGEKK